MLRRFLYEIADASVIDGAGLQVDRELVRRNAERARLVIRSMGPKWCLHNPNPPIDMDAANDESERAAHSHGEDE